MQRVGFSGEKEALSDSQAILLRERRFVDNGADLATGIFGTWYVLGPRPFSGITGEVALDQEQMAEEAFLRPSQARTSFETPAIEWRSCKLAFFQIPGLIDFGTLYRGSNQWSVAYALSFIHSERDQNGLVLRVGSDDQAKIYLNGQNVYRHSSPRAYAPDQDVTAGVELKAGLNVLLFKVVNEDLLWLGSVRLTDAAGQPVKGITVTLEPK